MEYTFRMERCGRCVDEIFDARGKMMYEKFPKGFAKSDKEEYNRYYYEVVETKFPLPPKVLCFICDLDGEGWFSFCEQHLATALGELRRLNDEK